MSGAAGRHDVQTHEIRKRIPFSRFDSLFISSPLFQFKLNVFNFSYCSDVKGK